MGCDFVGRQHMSKLMRRLNWLSQHCRQVAQPKKRKIGSNANARLWAFDNDSKSFRWKRQAFILVWQAHYLLKSAGAFPKSPTMWGKLFFIRAVGWIDSSDGQCFLNPVVGQEEIWWPRCGYCSVSCFGHLTVVWRPLPLTIVEVMVAEQRSISFEFFQYSFPE